MSAAVWLGWLLTLPLRHSALPVIASGFPLLLFGSWAWARECARQPWRQFVSRTAGEHALLLVLLAAFGVQSADAHGVTTDGVIYFTQMRSAIFDRDLDVAAEFAYLGQPPRPSHVVPIGPTFVWLPLYLAVAAIDALGRALAWWPPPHEAVATGLTLPYIRAALVSSFAIGALGLLVIYRRLHVEFAPSIAFCGVLLVFAATPLVWYMVYEPSMTHAASFGFVAVFLVASERFTSVEIKPGGAILLGVLLGLAFMTRPQEAVFALFPATLLMMGHEPIAARLLAAGRLAGWALLGAIPCLALQALHSTILLAHEQFALAGEGGYLDLLHSRWADTLWSSWHGFFSWTPAAYVAFIAIFFYAARNRRWAVGAILIVVVMAWVNGATADWAGGWSFGGRRFTSVLAVLAPGFALLVHGAVRKPMAALGVLAAAAVFWNQLLMAQYASGMLKPDETVSFAQIVRQQAALTTRGTFVYPFAFPANAWFAWRTGLPIDRYDLLGAESPAPSFDLAMSANSAKYLMDGWGPRASDPFGELRWIEGSRAELIVPLAADPDSQATIAVHARTRLLDPQEPATFALVVNGHEVGALTPETQQASTETFTVAKDVLKAGFNRVVLERRSGSAPVGIYRLVIGAS